jgi:polar amino acid transport system ATP-binding protein
MATSPVIIKLVNVHKAFGSTVVLDNFSTEIRLGEKLAIIGPSGSGKSTLLRILMTLEPIDRGSIILDGDYLWRDSGVKSVQAARAELRKIRGKVGMVFQNFNLFPHMTALRNVAEAPLRVLKLSARDAETRARELLALVGLANKTDHYPIQLSGGQQQRVAIARALAMKPKR